MSTPASQLRAAGPGAVFEFPALERVITGRPFAEALGDEADRLGARAVFVLASRTLAETTDALVAVRRVLGARFAAFGGTIPAHVPRDAVAAAARAARAAGADLLVGIGGGSIADGVKMVKLCLANWVDAPADLDRLRRIPLADGGFRSPEVQAPAIPSIHVPTTLSGAEFHAPAGCTDPARRIKDSFSHPRLIPQSVILDPALGVHTPDWLWLSTGVRAVDHAVEAYLSVRPHPLSDGLALHALGLLCPALRRSRAAPHDLAARFDAQIGMWAAMMRSFAGVPFGASHGIGHALGPFGVPHGYTSCVLLAPVLRYNAAVNGGRQARIAAAMGRPGADAADAVAELVGDLGLPGRLRDVGVERHDFDAIARAALDDHAVRANPRPLRAVEDVRAILEAAW